MNVYLEKKSETIVREVSCYEMKWLLKLINVLCFKE